MLKQSLLNEISKINNLQDLMELNKFVMTTRSNLGKTTLSVGDKVYVVQKTKRTPGTVTKVKRTRCVVDMQGGSYNVPLSMIEVA